MSWITRSAFVSDLRVLLAARDFRRLFSTRLVSQTGDGVFTAGVGTYVFFNATTFTSPAKGAAAFTVVYLPYSLIGPFAGVFIDRWSRRQILVVSALLRSVFVVLTAALMVSGRNGPPLYIAVLLVLGVNRFFLASLSAALPHVVPDDELVMANSVSPTAGGIMAAIGGIVALGLNAATGDTERGAAITLLVAGGCYAAAGLVAMTMRRDLLGPSREPGVPAGRLPGELASVVADLAAGARYVLRRRGPASALGATGFGSFLFGILSLMMFNVTYVAGADLSAAFMPHSGKSPPIIALVIPPASRRMSKRACITLLLFAGAVVIGALGETFDQIAFLAIGFCLYLARQGMAICTVTILQEEVDDVYRGRLFAFYDVMFNVTYVAGADLSAAFMPHSGKSPPIIALVAAGYVVAAAGYWMISRQPSAGGEPGTSSPSSAAQARSS